MRFHVLGIGPIGSLVAFHLRRTLLPTHPISLVVRTKRRARELRVGGGIAVEHGGMVITQGGYDVELFDPLEEMAFDLVYNKDGEMRLPTETAQTWRRTGEIEPAKGINALQRPIESLIVCSKADSTLPIFRLIKQRLTAASTIVLLQNGMGVYDKLVDELFRNPFERPQFIVATSSHVARSKSYTNIVHTVHAADGSLSFGVVPDPRGERDFELSKYNRLVNYYDRALNLDDLAPAPKEGEAKDRCASLRATVAALSALTALNTSWLPLSEQQVQLKRKLVVNAVINPLSAISQCANGAIFYNRHARSMAKRICDEAAAVFATEAANDAGVLEDGATIDGETIGGTIEVPHGLGARELEAEVYRISRRTSLNYSSMLQDLWKGRHTEVEYMNGHLHRLGEKFGVPTPYNDTMYAMIKMKEQVIPVTRM